MGKVVLTIDDSKAVRDMIGFTLQPHGYQVYEAENGQEGLRQLDAVAPALVITDLNMPVMNGIEFIEKARALDESPWAAFRPLLTTETAPEMKARGKAAGATGWIDKPFDANKLIAVANKLLG